MGDLKWPLVAAAMLWGTTASSAMPLQIQAFPGGRYVTGGVGGDEQAEMES